jgi:hypothetical protein
VVALDRPPSESASAKVAITTGTIGNNDALVDHIEGKEEEKVEHKKKEPVFIKGVELIDLDDCEVLDMMLRCDNDHMDDDNVPNPRGVDVGDSATLCLQTRVVRMPICPPRPPTRSPVTLDRPSHPLDKEIFEYI